MVSNQTELDNIIATLNGRSSPAELPQAHASIVSKPATRQLRPERWTEGERTPTASETAFRLGVDGQRAGADLLADPYASRFVYLDKPIHIWPYPTLDVSQLIATHIAPSNSWAKIHLYEEARAFHTQLFFYYLWRNESLNPVVISASAPLVMSGSCSATGSGGFFGGHTSLVSVNAYLAPQRWIGWGVDPGTGLSLDHTYIPSQEQSQWATISLVSATGSWGFGYRAFSSASRTRFVMGLRIVRATRRDVCESWAGSSPGNHSSGRPRVSIGACVAGDGREALIVPVTASPVHRP